MKRPIFLKGALTGALIVLLAAGLASCGLLKSEESRKMELLESLIDRYYIGEADAEASRRASTRATSRDWGIPTPPTMMRRRQPG